MLVPSFQKEVVPDFPFSRLQDLHHIRFSVVTDSDMKVAISIYMFYIISLLIFHKDNMSHNKNIDG